MKKAAILLVVLTSIYLSAFACVNALAATPTFTTLQPGQFREINQNLQINVVFIGFGHGAGPADIKESAFRAGLSHYNRAINVFPLYWNRFELTGNSFTYNYDVSYADMAFEDSFFNYLTGIASPAPRTEPQDLYNTQNTRSLNVGQNHLINAELVENWLGQNINNIPGVDTRKYTVVFINWYGRPDFKFHVYEPPHPVDQDGNLILGQYDWQKLNAWGGTAPDDAETGPESLRRLWFYDVSAGPTQWGVNWSLDQADLDGDGQLDYRIPLIWEYGNQTAYRPFNDLSGDLALLTRYVAIDMLFTTSPVFNPAISAPRLPSGFQMDVNAFNAVPGVNILDITHFEAAAETVGKLRPYNTFSVESTNENYSNVVRGEYLCWKTWLDTELANIISTTPTGCSGANYSYFSLSNYFKNHVNQYWEGGPNHEIPIFLFNTTNADDNAVLVGLATSEAGRQSVILDLTSSDIREFQGTSYIAAHEIGHYLGLNHPHDNGVDWEAGTVLNPTGDLYFIWTADESPSVMSYITISTEFDQFERDNMNRWMTAAYLNQANQILGRITSSPRGGQVAAELAAADTKFTSSLASYGELDYLGAVRQAKLGYEMILSAASRIGVQVEPESWPADVTAQNSRGIISEVFTGPRRHGHQ